MFEEGKAVSLRSRYVFVGGRAGADAAEVVVRGAPHVRVASQRHVANKAIAMQAPAPSTTRVLREGSTLFVVAPTTADSSASMASKRSAALFAIARTIASET
jgi:hypothetical protein